MNTKWMKLVNDITETAEKWKRDNRNFLVVVDNPKENNYHAALHGSYEEIARMIATIMLRKGAFADAMMHAVQIFMTQRNKESQ